MRLSSKIALIIIPAATIFVVLTGIFIYSLAIGVGTGSPRDATEAIDISFSLVIILSLISVLFVIVLLIMMRVFVLRPLASLRRGVEAFAAGNLEQRLAVTRKDELGVLAGSFNAMADRIGSLTKGLKGEATESEKRLQEIVENINDVFYIVSPDFSRTFYISPGYEKIWGRQPEQLYSDAKAWSEAVVPEDRGPLFAAMRRITDSGKPLREGEEPSFRITRPDGSIRWVQGRTIPVLNADGTIHHLVGVARDITESREAEIELTKTFKRTQSIFNAQNDAVFVITNDRVITDMNSAAERMFGYGFTEAKGKSSEMFHVDRDHFERFGKAAYEKGRALFERGFEWDMRRKDGQVFPAEFSFSSLADEKGVQTGLVVVIRDITERKAAEQSTKRFRQLLDQSNDGIEVVDPDTLRYIDVNNTATAHLGYSRQELLKMTVLETNPSVTPEMVSGLRAQLLAGKSVLFETIQRRKDGTTFPVEISMTEVKEGESRYAVAVVRDITERKKNEVRIQEADLLKNKFIQIVSHQFRTPLNAIRWNLEALLGDSLGAMKPEQKEFLRITHDADVEVIERVSDLLTAMDIEEGRIRLESQPISLESLLASVFGVYKQRCVPRDVDCEYLPPKTPVPPITADPDKIRVVFERLILNAITYTPAHGKVVATIVQASDAVRFEVTDTGIGIPVAEQPRIFTAFYRASNASAMMPDASGLGLYLAKYFVEQHGGKIGFDSEEGKGSTFWFEIPVKS